MESYKSIHVKNFVVYISALIYFIFMILGLFFHRSACIARHWSSTEGCSCCSFTAIYLTLDVTALNARLLLNGEIRSLNVTQSLKTSQFPGQKAVDKRLILFNNSY